MTEMPVTPRSDTVPGWESPVVREEAGLFPWWMVLMLGIVAILFGIAVLAWPHASLKVMAVLVGCWLLLAGFVRIVGAFLPSGSIGRNVLSGVVGLLLVIAGSLCLRDLVTALDVLALMVALTWLFSGLAETTLALQANGATKGWLLVVGLLSVAIGFVFLFVPRLSLASLILFTGISALVLGAGELVVAFQLRTANRRSGSAAVTQA